MFAGDCLCASFSFDVVGFEHVDVGLVPKPEKVQG